MASNREDSGTFNLLVFENVGEAVVHWVFQGFVGMDANASLQGGIYGGHEKINGALPLSLFNLIQATSLKTVKQRKPQCHKH